MPHITSRFVDCHVFRRRSDGADEWLVLRRSPGFMGDTWQMVSGTIEGAEKAYQCAQRELLEETGLRPKHFYQASYVNRFYLAATDEIVLSPVFAAEVGAGDEVRLSEEHTDFAWVPWQEAMRRFPWPGQRKALAVIREQFIEAKPFDPSCIDGYLDD
ncbi:MAG: NUDIX domain-containing protein [Candidatus Thermoplasmatota archaeon]